MKNFFVGEGYLKFEPRHSYTGTGKSVCNFILSMPWDGGKGSDDVPCTAWEEWADYVVNTFAKGSAVKVTGRISNRRRKVDDKWTDDVKITVTKVEPLEASEGGGQDAGIGDVIDSELSDDDVPF